MFLVVSLLSHCDVIHAFNYCKNYTAVCHLKHFRSTCLSVLRPLSLQNQTKLLVQTAFERQWEKHRNEPFSRLRDFNPTTRNNGSKNNDSNNNNNKYNTVQTESKSGKNGWGGTSFRVGDELSDRLALPIFTN